MGISIAYYGYFNDYSGHGHAAREYVKLLIKLGYKVHAESLSKSNNEAHGHDWNMIRKQVKEPFGSYDYLILHLTPFFQDDMIEDYSRLPEWSKSKQKVLFTVFETDLWPETWVKGVKQFDKIVTFSKWQLDAAKKLINRMSFKVPVHLVHHNVNHRQQQKKIEGKYTFYSEFSRVLHRKGLDILLNAYLMAFDYKDAVRLSIKLPAIDDDYQVFNDQLSKSKSIFAYKKPPEININRQWLSDSTMNELLNESDCYVCSARGEGFSLPLAKAAVAGKTVLYPENSWGSDYCKYGEYKAQKVYVYSHDFIKFGLKINTTEMQWFEPSVRDLAFAMKAAMAGKYKTNKKAKETLSDETVGEQLKAVLK